MRSSRDYLSPRGRSGVTKFHCVEALPITADVERCYRPGRGQPITATRGAFLYRWTTLKSVGPFLNPELLTYRLEFARFSWQFAVMQLRRVRTQNCPLFRHEPMD